MSEPKESKKNPLINYFQESYEELKKVTWPTRNQAIKLTFIVIGFCIVLSFLVGVLDFAFNEGYRSLVDLSQKISPPAATNPVTTPVATGEPTSSVDLSKIKIAPSPAPVSDVKINTGTTQQK
jgi:preprotein translocase subunit SecE